MSPTPTAESGSGASALGETPLTEVRGQAVREAQQLVAAANQALEAAVVAERARGTSWEEIGEALGGVTRSTAHGRFAQAVEAFSRPEDGSPLEVEMDRLAAADRNLAEAWGRVEAVATGRAARGNMLALSGHVHQLFNPGAQWINRVMNSGDAHQRAEANGAAAEGSREAYDAVVRDLSRTAFLVHAKAWPKMGAGAGEHASVADAAVVLMEALTRFMDTAELRPLTAPLVRAVSEEATFVERLTAARSEAAHGHSLNVEQASAVIRLSGFVERDRLARAESAANSDPGVKQTRAAAEDSRLADLERRLAGLEARMGEVDASSAAAQANKRGPHGETGRGSRGRVPNDSADELR